MICVQIKIGCCHKITYKSASHAMMDVRGASAEDEMSVLPTDVNIDAALHDDGIHNDTLSLVPVEHVFFPFVNYKNVFVEFSQTFSGCRPG